VEDHKLEKEKILEHPEQAERRDSGVENQIK
jgi:hypothetical protein